jgi:hypothetical protein
VFVCNNHYFRPSNSSIALLLKPADNKTENEENILKNFKIALLIQLIVYLSAQYQRKEKINK